jgi:hypothetical protein
MIKNIVVVKNTVITNKSKGGNLPETQVIENALITIAELSNNPRYAKKLKIHEQDSGISKKLKKVLEDEGDNPLVAMTSL